ncbi:MAG: BLUF domain-containing protein [Rubrivivax sp.]
MTPLTALAYLSSATHPFDEAALEALLLDARKRNREQGVTGVLLHHDGSFFQYLEGPADGVDTVYARIRASRQHHGLIELFRWPCPARLFDGWTMGFAHAPRGLVLTLEQAAWADVIEHSQQRRDKPPGLQLLLDFWRQAERR